MGILNRDAILGAEDIKTETVPVPEWGGEVLVKTLTGTERDAFELSTVKDGKDGKKKADLTNLRAKLCARTICDEEGELLFTDSDIIELGKKSGAALDRVFAVAQKLSGIGEADLEEMVKNSAMPGQDGGSTSD